MAASAISEGLLPRPLFLWLPLDVSSTGQQGLDDLVARLARIVVDEEKSVVESETACKRIIENASSLDESSLSEAILELHSIERLSASFLEQLGKERPLIMQKISDLCIEKLTAAMSAYFKRLLELTRARALLLQDCRLQLIVLRIQAREPEVVAEIRSAADVQALAKQLA